MRNRSFRIARQAYLVSTKHQADPAKLNQGNKTAHATHGKETPRV